MKMRKIKRVMTMPNGMIEDMPQSKPRVEFTGQDLPEMEDWDIGQTYTLTIEVEMTSIRKGNEWNDKDKETRGTFKVNAIGVGLPDKKKKDTLEDGEYAEMMNKARGV